MFEFLTCKVTEVADKAIEVIDKTAGITADVVCLVQLRKEWIGQVTKVSESPEVFVMVSDVLLEDTCGLCSADSFTIKGLTCQVEVEVRQAAARSPSITADDAENLFDAIFGVPKPALPNTAAWADATASPVASEEEFDVVLDLEKLPGKDTVIAKVVAVKSLRDAMHKDTDLSMVEEYIEVAVSRQVSRALKSARFHSCTHMVAKEMSITGGEKLLDSVIFMCGL